MNKSKGVNIAENKLSNPPPCLSVLDQRVVNLGMTHVLDSYYTYNDVVRFIWDNGGYCSQILSLSLSSDVFRYSYDGSAHDNQRILATIRLSGLSGKPELLVGRTPLELSSQNQATITPEMMDGDSLTIVASLGGFSDTKIITKLRDAPSLELMVSRESARYYADGFPYADQDIVTTVRTDGLSEVPVLTCDDVVYPLVNNRATFVGSNRQWGGEAGAYYRAGDHNLWGGGGAGASINAYGRFDASRVVPTTMENRPVSMSLYTCIRVL